MVYETTIAVLGTLAGSVITGIVALYTTRIQQRKKSKRIHGEYYLDKKVGYLGELNGKLVEADSCMGAILTWENPDLAKEEEGVYEAISHLDEYELALLKQKYILTIMIKYILKDNVDVPNNHRNDGTRIY